MFKINLLSKIITLSLLVLPLLNACGPNTFDDFKKDIKSFYFPAISAGGCFGGVSALLYQVCGCNDKKCPLNKFPMNLIIIDTKNINPDSLPKQPQLIAGFDLEHNLKQLTVINPSEQFINLIKFAANSAARDGHQTPIYQIDEERSPKSVTYHLRDYKPIQSVLAGEISISSNKRTFSIEGFLGLISQEDSEKTNLSFLFTRILRERHFLTKWNSELLTNKEKIARHLVGLAKSGVDLLAKRQGKNIDPIVMFMCLYMVIAENKQLITDYYAANGQAF